MKKELFDSIPCGEKQEGILMDDVNGLYAYEKGDKIRWMKESSGCIFVFAKGRRSRGYRLYNAENFYQNVNPASKISAGEKWSRQVKKVINLIRKNGLWEKELLASYEKLSLMTWEDLCSFRNMFWADPLRRSRTIEDTDEYNEKVRTYYGDMLTKYPFLTYIDKDGRLNIDWFFISEEADAKTKSMYFGASNKHYKENIRKALENRQDYSIYRIPVGYDVTFEYKAEKNMAWYSEEYKGCGNGHYYLALSADTALFCEND